MAEYEPSIGATSEWFTPPEIFEALGLEFDLDPCSPGPGHWVPARKIFTSADDGLAQPWEGLVFMNPPFGGRNGHVPWLRKWLEHANGVAIVRAYTSSAWFHQWAVKAQTMLFPRGKTKFIRPDGSIGRAPGHGIVLLGMGEVANDALRESALGFCVAADGSVLPMTRSKLRTTTAQEASAVAGVTGLLPQTVRAEPSPDGRKEAKVSPQGSLIQCGGKSGDMRATASKTAITP